MLRARAVCKMFGAGSKRGLFDIEDFFSFIVYTLILFMFLIILSVPNCSLRPEEKLTSSLDKLDRLNSEQELVEMLRTKLPDNLPQFIENKKSLKISTFGLYYRISDYDEAKETLEKNPWLYKGLTYSEFIDRLGFFAEDLNVKKSIFALTTRALFVKDIYPPHVKELDTSERTFLTYPEIYVKYNVAGGFSYDIDADLENFPISRVISSGVVFQVIPLTDKSVSPAFATIALPINKNMLSELSESDFS